jgi:ergothioneine biosynthesis protein EgtB
MIVEHELMHQETLMYMAQRLPAGDLVRPEWLPEPVLGAGRPVAGATRVRIPAGTATLGARAGALDFGWDNEFPSSEVSVPGFSLDAAPVTNAEFRAFVDDGGYRRADLWRDEDWTWREGAGLEHPVAWERDRTGWRCRALLDSPLLAAVGAWPVYVSLAEARAYARWQGRRLPTEAEYHRAAFGAPVGPDRPFPWGETPPDARHGNFDFAQWGPMPVGSHAEGASAWGVHDLVGDGWEWTDTPFAGHPGFSPMPRYPGYSADFFDGKHAVLKGASWATGAALIRPSFRNWFQAHYPYVFAKFRCAAA